MRALDAVQTRDRAPGRFGRCTTLAAAAALLMLTTITVPGCDRRPRAGRIGNAPVHRVYRIERDSSGKFTSREFGGRYQFRRHPVPRRPAPALPRGTPRMAIGQPGSKLHPSLIPLLAGGPPDSLLHLIVSFRDSIPIPVFPRRRTDLARTSAINLDLQHQADSLILALRGARAARYMEDSTTLVTIPDVTLKGRFWLIQAVVLDATVARLLTLDSLANVTNVRPVNAGEHPPSTCPDGTVDARCPNTDDSDDIAAAIDQIGMNDWKSTDYDQGWLGVLDTGVFTEHVLLSSVLSSANFFQCEKSCPNKCPEDFGKCTDCPTSNPGDLCEEGHGTATAGILVGSNTSFTRQQGMTRASLDWFSVYDQDCKGDCDDPTSPAILNACAAVRAFEYSIRRGNPVILAEVAAEADDDESVQDPIDVAAAHAFQTGAAVISAAGNTPDGGAIAGPAREATVVAVGARYLYDWDEDPTQSPAQRSGTVGGRYKPELLAPTKIESPSRCSDHAFTYYSYTSGATPYVAGVASIFNEWLAKTTGATDPGQTYAQLIVSGSLVGSFSNTKAGVGLLGAAPLSSVCWANKVELATESVQIDLEGDKTGITTVEAALWWPESQRTDGTRPHHKVTLQILDATGNPVEKSEDDNNVFQRVSVDAKLLGTDGFGFRWRWVKVCLWFVGCISLPMPVIETKTWSILITQESLLDPGEVQTVYWSVVGRK